MDKHYFLTAEQFAELAEQWSDRMRSDEDIEFDEGTDEPSELESEVARLLKDMPCIDFTQIDGVTCYLTDDCYQVYIGDDLFLDYVGPDARNFVTSVLIFKKHKHFRDQDWLILCYDSGMTSTPLVPGERVRYIRLCKRDMYDDGMPPVKLLRPTAIRREWMDR